MAKSAWISSVGTDDFKTQVIERSREIPVVVDFWAPWCAPCRALTPLLERQINERQGAVLLAKVNIDEAQELAADYDVSSIPTVIAFRDGRPFLDFVGLLSEAEMRAFFDRLAPSEADRLVKDATVLEKSSPAEAEKLYRDALALDRAQDAAAIGLARVLTEQGKDADARAVLENVAATGELAEEAERLQARLFLREQAGAAGSEEEARRRLAADPKNGTVLYQLGCVLAAAGRYPEALEQLLAAGQLDHALASSRVREAMVKIFQIIGVRSALADEYRDKLTALLY
ncbi:MAG: tetratricopeptide repeat protein [Planctomycetes bacterium]|nr:tetratricopeptide repeat protein [Planctomycetota bacterium]